MKKNTLALAFSLFVLAGCSDAKASLKDANTALVKVGNTSITKGDIFPALMTQSGMDTVITNARREICNLEIEVTDDIKQEAQNSLEQMKQMYGENFTAYLESIKSTEEDYLNQSVIPSLQASKLPEKYINDNFDEIAEAQQPVKAIVLTFDTEENANAALGALKDGSANAEEIAVQYQLTESGKEMLVTLNDTSYESTVTSVIRSASPEDGWAMIPGSDSSIYLVKIVENQVENMKDEIIEKLASDSGIQDEALAFYFKKYNFKVYDIDLYNAIKETYPTYLGIDSAESK